MPLHLNDEELDQFIRDLNAEQEDLEARLAEKDDAFADAHSEN